MANRKVLINRHTSTSGAPIASEMFKGEIAVAHKTGEEILWTKNNDDIMVPFISCAQTISIIDSKVQASEDVVKAKANEAHLEVESGGTTGATEWILSTKDIQSENEFKAYSAETKTKIDKNVSAITDTLGIISALTNVVVTDISGDTIIVAEKVDATTGSNSYNLTHKQAPSAIAIGFNKLATDAYGHVTGSSAVEAADIEGLGFKNSAWTEEKITEAIEGLNSSSATTDNRHYVTAITIENGKIVSFGEATDPQLSVESAGTGNVVSQITVADHKISYTTTSVATSEDIQKLSAATMNLSGVVGDFSAATYNKFSSAFTAINNLSADTEAADGKVFTSAKTYTDKVIAALDSSKVATDNRHYITAITIEDGELSTIGEAEIPVLASAATGTGNVVTDIAVNDHTITYNRGLKAASDADLEAVSGIVDTFSAATVAEFNSAFTTIQAMDKAASAEDGKVVTTVSEVDGVVSETKANVKDLQLGGYVKDTAATGDIAGTDTINAALSKLENKANANKIANADGSINATTGATGTDINVNIKSGEHVLAKDGNAGLYTNIKLSAVTASSDLVKEEYALYGTDNTILGDHIKIYKDQSLVSITLEDNDGSGHTGQYLKYTYIDASGATQSTYVNVSSFLVEAEFKSGVTADANGVVHGVVDPASEKDSNNDSFLTVGADGFKVDGIKDEIDAKIAALDVTDTAADGQYISAVNEVDGKVSMTRANVSEAVLNNYAKGSDSSAVVATDTVNQAISKLEKQVDAAKAAATTKVVEGTDAGNNMTITPTTSATDGSVTYTVDLTDVASKTALDAEIAARKAVDGQNGDAYAANTNANFISAATSLNDADVKLDAAIFELSSNTISAIEALDSSSAATDSGHYITAITITDGKISAVADEAIPANVAITATTAAPSDAASAVLTGITADGKDNHNLTFGMSNKVFSASTADEAVKVKSALTINVLDSAGTTASTVTFDGSSNQAIDIPGSHDTATTEDGHYAPSTTASSLDAAAGAVISTITLDSKKHVISAGTTDKINSASTAESADTATKVNNALSISGYSDSSASTLDTAFAYDGSNAQSLTFGTNGPAGLKSMSMTSAGLVDVEVIDCGEY